jgi:cysteine desulfurase
VLYSLLTGKLQAKFAIRQGMSLPIYLDGFASLPVAPHAREVMMDAFARPGNAASPHRAGEAAAHLIAQARTEVAILIGASPGEIVFTSGATEANNLALLGVARALRGLGCERRRILVSAIEHKAVLEPAHALQQEGFELILAPVTGAGLLNLEAYEELVDENVLIASVMAVNNETGVIQPIREAAELAHRAGALFHCDAAQAAGKIELDVTTIDADYLSLSSHKLYGPMGIGALYVAAGAPNPDPLLYGGGQQAGLRPGTEPVALIAGFGAAARIATRQHEADAVHGRHLAELFLTELAKHQVRFEVVTENAEVVPGSVSIRLLGIDADHLCVTLADRVQLSTGSACNSGQLKSSHVLEAMGFSPPSASEVMRAFFHRYIDEADVRSAAGQIAAAARQSAVATGGAVQ